MKFTVTKVIFLLIFISTAFATVELIRPGLEASPYGEDIKLKWSTGVEENLISFIIERSTNPEQEESWSEIGNTPPTGNYSNYSYIDKSAYKTNDLLFYYRLKIHVNENRQYVYSNVYGPVYPQLSGVKRTWGSIKAMFR